MSNEVPPKGGKDHYAQDIMQPLGAAIDDVLPQGWGFFLMVFPHGDGEGRFNYIANGRREDVLKVMQNFIDKNKSNPELFGQHSSDKI